VPAQFLGASGRPRFRSYDFLVFPDAVVTPDQNGSAGSGIVRIISTKLQFFSGEPCINEIPVRADKRYTTKGYMIRTGANDETNAGPAGQAGQFPTTHWTLAMRVREDVEGEVDWIKSILAQ